MMTTCHGCFKEKICMMRTSGDHYYCEECAIGVREAMKTNDPAHHERRFIAACHAMQGLLNHTFAYREDMGAMAKDAVIAADALLKELEK